MHRVRVAYVLGAFVLPALVIATSVVGLEHTGATLQDNSAATASFDSVPTLWWAQGDDSDGVFGSGSTGPGADVAQRVSLSPSSDVPPGAQTSALSAGEDFACAAVAGRAVCWGDNSSGQLGDGTTDEQTVPRAVQTAAEGSSELPADAVVTDVSTGVGFACAVADGRVYCWGDNSSGQLGDGTTTASLVPVAVTTSGSGGSALPDGSATAVATGGGGPGSVTGYTCAIAAERLYCWGSRENGRLGTGVSGATPWLVPAATIPMWGVEPVTDVSLGASAACAVAGGRVWCWGWARWGQLGDGDSHGGTDQNVAILVQTSPASELPSSAEVTEVAVGATSVCALHAGRPYCWGTNLAGQLGADGVIDTDPATEQVSLAVEVAEVGTGSSQLPVGATSTGLAVGSREQGASTYCLLAAVGATTAEPYCWGANAHGQLGVGDQLDRAVPALVLRQPQSMLPTAATVALVAPGNGVTILVPQL